MPGDETYVHLIDALGGQGPLWLFVAGVLVIAAFVAVKALPVIRDVQKGRLSIEEKREARKADEARLRDKRDREHAETSARMVDAMNRQAAGDQAMAAALTAISTKLEASQAGSRRMGEQVDEIAHQVDDIHAATVRHKP